MDGCDVAMLGTLDTSANTIAVVGDIWWQQETKRAGGKVSLCGIWQKGTRY